VAYFVGSPPTSAGVDTIVLTEMEHHANLVPWQILVQEKDGDLEFVPVSDDGLLQLDVYEVLLHLRPKLVAFTHVSDMLGTINPVREMVEMAHGAGALVLIDGAQAGAAHAGGRPGARRRFLPSSAATRCSADRLRCAVGAPRAARGDAARSWPGGDMIREGPSAPFD